jgi:phosphatidate phosphatase PAH1
VIVSDIEGTLTGSENAYPYSLVLGGDVAAQPDAPAALVAATARGVNIVYTSARGDRFTQDTRNWLAAKGFPRGVVKLPRSIITLPGEDTIEAKTELLGHLDGLDLLAGIGNRATDVAAYGNAGLPPERIFIKLPEFEGELAADLEAEKATSFDMYETLRGSHLAAMFAR